jgi:DNA-binding response OmpR family regulator
MISEPDRIKRVQLETEVEDLKFEVKRLNKLLIPISTFEPGLKLTPLETKILSCILARSPRLIAQHQIMDALYYDENEKAPEYNLISVVIYKIRKKLNPLGITIARKYGEGLMLDEENAERLRAYRLQGEPGDAITNGTIARA